MKQSLVSIIIPVYNSERYLKYCLDSVASQTYRNLEILLIDDGSSDNSGSICDDYAYRDHRFIVFHKENHGIASSQNIGLRHAKGQYIAFADNDDILSRQNIEKLVYALESTGADMAKARWQQIGVSQLEKISVLSMKKTPIGHRTLFENPLKEYQTVFSKILRLVHGKSAEARYFNEANWCRLYRREVWEGIQFPEGHFAQDVMVAGELYLRMRRVVDINEILYYWLQTPNSVTHKERGFAFFHDNVVAGARNFELSLQNGIVPQRSFYTLTGSVKLEKTANDIGSLGNTEQMKKDIRLVTSLAHKLSPLNRAICTVTASLRLMEKVVYDHHIHQMS